MRIRIQLFISMRIQIRIQIQGAKPIRIHADPEPDQTSKSQKVEFYMKNIPYLKKVIGQKTYGTYEGTNAFLKGRKPESFLNFGNFHATGSGSAFRIRIRFRIQDSRINADPDPQHWFIYIEAVVHNGMVPPKLRTPEPGTGRIATGNKF